MTSKRQALYEKVIDHMIATVEENVGCRPEPELIMSDYEMAILSALSSRFPNSRVRGCFFHYSQVRSHTNQPQEKQIYFFVLHLGYVSICV